MNVAMNVRHVYALDLKRIAVQVPQPFRDELQHIATQLQVCSGTELDDVALVCAECNNVVPLSRKQNHVLTHAQ